VNYLLTSPIHHSQKLLANNQKLSRFSIQVIPNYELMRELLSYGKELKVISPKSMVKELKQEILQMRKNYR
jgi:predicted DNA-binding transcriptional regulator YafY